MSGLLLVLGLAALLASVALLVYSLVPVPTLAARALQVRRVEASQIGSLWLRLLFPILNLLAPIFEYVPWRRYRAKAAVNLSRAGLGDTITVNHLLAMKALSAVVTPFVLSFLFELFSNYGMFVLAGIGGFYLPDRLVSDMRKKRERLIVRALPGAVDVLSLSVEAGLEFLMAIQRLVERRRIGPLRDELTTVLNDIRLGKSRSEALKALAARVEIPEISSFVAVLVQADALGASIGPVLQSQAEQMRVERFQKAEREGAKASQKILFPLVLFIFPAVLIVIVGPVALNFIYGAR
jgi:tight adherence protein C